MTVQLPMMSPTNRNLETYDRRWWKRCGARLQDLRPAALPTTFRPMRRVVLPAACSISGKCWPFFDHVIESAKIGLRKPDPRIYQMMVEALGVDSANCVYLDDLGVNLKPARDIGMTTIKVIDSFRPLPSSKRQPGYRFVSSTKEVRNLDFAERFVDRRKAGRKLVARVRFRFREYIPTGFDTCRSHGRPPEQGRA